MGKFRRKTITIFCKYLDLNRNEKWEKVYIKGVGIQYSKRAGHEKYGSTNADSVVVNIFNDSVASKEYASPKEFLKDHEGKYTLKTGDKLVIGCVEYEMGSVKELESLCDDVFTITNIDLKDTLGGRLSHWEVGAK